MTIQFDRGAPGVRVVVLSSERDQIGEPLDLDGRIISFSYEDTEKKSDLVSLVLDNFDLSLFDRPELIGGAILEVSWGYPGNMAAPRRVLVKKLKGFQTLTIEGQAMSALMNRETRTRSWKNKSRAAVVREIAAQYGYPLAAQHVEETNEPLDSVNQTSETDARFLKRLAAREGFEFFVDDLGLHFRSRDQSSPATHVLTWYSDPGRGDVLSVNVESDLARRVGRAEVRARDPLEKATVTAAASSDSTERATLGETVEVIDPTSGTSSLLERNATASLQSSAAASATSVKREAEARFKKAERETIKLSLQVIGDPTLRAKKVLEVRGISRLLSGKYYATSVKHSISGSGYTAELKLTRDGVGRRASLEQTRTQGGEPNRTETPTTGELSAIELVDPRSGSTFVEYRQNGARIGFEDPESGMSVVR